MNVVLYFLICCVGFNQTQSLKQNTVKVFDLINLHISDIYLHIYNSEIHIYNYIKIII